MISVLRLGHRAGRDERITTHLCLVARAFGAYEVILSGDKAENIIKSIEKVNEVWGGSLKVTYEKNWKGVLKKWEKKGKIVHLTMYGEPIEKKIGEIKGNILIVLGAEKVPAYVYQTADYNIAIGSQPHSEVAALAVFLYALFKGKLPTFENAKMRIIPSAKGKNVIRTKLLQIFF